MDGWFDALISWDQFWSMGLTLVTIYVLLYLLQRRMDSGLYLRDVDALVRASVRVTLLVLDPLILLVMLGLFVALWPAVHGMIVLLLIVFAYRPLKEYIAGRIFRFDPATTIGRHLIQRDARGVINGFGLTGIYLQQEEGRMRIPYTELLHGGYTVAIDPEVSAYYHLLITMSEEQDEDEEDDDTAERGRQRRRLETNDLDLMTRQLRNRLVESPYVRRGFTIAPHAGGESGLVLDLDVGLHRGDHVRHLIRQLRESGFEASLINR